MLIIETLISTYWNFRYRALARPLTIGAGIFSVHFLIQTWALEFTTATNSGWIVAITPLTIAIMALLVLKEAIPPGHARRTRDRDARDRLVGVWR